MLLLYLAPMALVGVLGGPAVHHRRHQYKHSQRSAVLISGAAYAPARLATGGGSQQTITTSFACKKWSEVLVCTVLLGVLLATSIQLFVQQQPRVFTVCALWLCALKSRAPKHTLSILTVVFFAHLTPSTQSFLYPSQHAKREAHYVQVRPSLLPLPNANCTLPNFRGVMVCCDS